MAEYTGQGMYGTRQDLPTLPKRAPRSAWHETHDGKHSQTAPRWAYNGFAPADRQYHRLICVAPPDEVEDTMKLIAYDAGRFKAGTKAGEGGCSTPRCVANAETMALRGRIAYCEDHGVMANPQPEPQCTAGQIVPCRRNAQPPRDCGFCEEYEDNG